jgi:hypothetical protein
MKRLYLALAMLLTLGCGGIGDTTAEDARVIITQHNLFPDGHTEVTRTVGPIWLDEYDDTDVEGPWFEGSEWDSEDAELGSVRQGLSYGANSRYGNYSAATATDGRCPNSWSSPRWCEIPSTKSFKWFFYPSVNDGSDGIADASLVTEWLQAAAVTHVGGFTHCTGAVCSGNPQWNAWFDASNGTCTAGAVACFSQVVGATFTSGGRRFRKTVPYNQFGWDAGFPTLAAINIEPDEVNALTSGFPDAEAANAVQNTIEHELAHVIGLAHNPGGSTTYWASQIPLIYQDPGYTLTSSEVSAAAAYSP